MTRRWLGLVVIAGMLVFTAAVFGRLPDQIPTHWNMSGEVDDYSSRVVGAFFAPAIALLLWAVLPSLRRIDPRRQNYERFGDTFHLVINVVVLFLGVIHVLSLGTALGWPINMTRALMVVMGVMFIALGNYLPRVRSNWWIGIRTPWTMESESVWRETHRVAGFTFVIGGAVAALSSLLPSSIAFGVGFVGMMVGGLIPVVYSYVAYRREQKAGQA
jgi:uncharacterized membrane protein